MNGTIFCCTQGRHGWGNRPGGIAVSSRTNRTHQTHFVPDCQGALAGMGVKRDKEEKVMCQGAAGTDTRILKKQVCPSRDEQDEREDGWAGEPANQVPPSQPSSHPRCKMPFILPLVRLRPSFLCAAGRSEAEEARGDPDATRRIDNEGIKANCFSLQQKP